MLKPKKKTPKPATAPGISASGNALVRIVGSAIIVALVPVLLGFAYLLTARDPGLQAEQISQVSSAYANQQSVNVQQLVSRLKARLEGAAKSPLALSAIEGEPGDLPLIEQTMKDYFPEVASMHILPIGKMGTAEFERGKQSLRNHIEVDLVRRTSIGEPTLPEAYQIDGRWLTSLATLVSHPQILESRAVIIATIDNQLVTDELNAMDTSLGRSALQQFYPAEAKERIDEIATAGTGAITSQTQYAAIENTNWNLAFTPSQQLLDKLAVSSMPVISVFLVFLVAIIAAAAIVLLLYPRVLASEVDKIIQAADRKTPLVLKVPELIGLAKQLRRATLRSLRQSGAPAASLETTTAPPAGSPDLSNPLTTSILTEGEEVLELDMDESSEKLAAAFPDHIFRAYDIRGIAKTELPDEMVAKIGGAIGRLAQKLDQQAIIVACDGRVSSPRIKTGLIKALMESGRDVIDIGTVPTPLLYFATRYLDCKSGVMVTGSHNPADFNGFKIVLEEQTIAAGGIQEIRTLAKSGQFTVGSGRIIREDVMPAYIEEIVSDIAIAIPLKIVFDAGNGVAGLVAPELFEELGCEVIPLYCDIDGRFPNHPPDTSNEDNLQDLVAMVRQEKADFGVAFDGDGDRLAVVTSSGEIVRSDVLLMIYAQDVVSRNPGADVVFDVKCSRNLSQLITRHGGRPVLWKTGHAFMKEKMRETGALLGGEFSGHMFFGERWYGFDDGMYAAGRLAEILSTRGASLDEILAELPESVGTPEILIPIEESRKFSVMERIVANADFSSGKINTLDGIRVDYKDGWGLVRASNTSAALTARFEASSEGGLEIIKQEFRAQIALVEPDLDLDF
ncbi:MAG: phosphomannomutase/phosphoglucomutase [Halioglobus sp.]